MKKLYFDMDGTCADFFEKSDCLERMYEKGFFTNLKPLPLATIINVLADQRPEQVFIISASLGLDTDIEKNEWLNQFIPKVKQSNRIFTRVGDDKSNYLHVTADTILIDDYSHNLIQWQDANGSVIKALNGINNSSNRWDSTIDVYSIQDCMMKLMPKIM